MWGMWAAMAPAALVKGNVLSCMHLDSSSKPSGARLFRLDLLDILRLRVWMPSFFIVSGLLTYGERDRGRRMLDRRRYPFQSLPAGAFSTFFSSKNNQQGMTFINMANRETLFEK